MEHGRKLARIGLAHLSMAWIWERHASSFRTTGFEWMRIHVGPCTMSRLSGRQRQSCHICALS